MHFTLTIFALYLSKNENFRETLQKKMKTCCKILITTCKKSGVRKREIMKKLTKKLMGMVLALVLCLAAVPAEVSMAAEVDYTKLTEEQLEAIVFGEWESYGIPQSVSRTEATFDGQVYATWIYEGMVEFNAAVLDEEDYEMLRSITNPQNPDGVTNALKFTDGTSEYYFYYGLDASLGESTLLLHTVSDNEGASVYPLIFKVVNNDTIKFAEVVERLDEFMVETPATEKVEEPATEDVTTEEPKETTTTEPSEEVTATEPSEEVVTTKPSEEVTTTEKTEEPAATEPKKEITATEKETVSKTTDGRDVYAGEEVYKVVKGDCLWSIAKKFFGNGAKYKELFTRNNGIIEKAELIFPGQEIIYIPAK